MNYEIEVYEKTFNSSPLFYLRSSSPFGSISVGDYFHLCNEDTCIEQPHKDKYMVLGNS